ncbi:hypothetical protein OF83DRAFT_1089657, partial [Amylostereum chailletii]
MSSTPKQNQQHLKYATERAHLYQQNISETLEHTKGVGDSRMISDIVIQRTRNSMFLHPCRQCPPYVSIVQPPDSMYTSGNLGASAPSSARRVLDRQTTPSSLNSNVRAIHQSKTQSLGFGIKSATERKPLHPTLDANPWSAAATLAAVMYIVRSQRSILPRKRLAESPVLFDWLETYLFPPFNRQFKTRVFDHLRRRGKQSLSLESQTVRASSNSFFGTWPFPMTPTQYRILPEDLDLQSLQSSTSVLRLNLFKIGYRLLSKCTGSGFDTLGPVM